MTVHSKKLTKFALHSSEEEDDKPEVGGGKGPRRRGVPPAESDLARLCQPSTSGLSNSQRAQRTSRRESDSRRYAPLTDDDDSD